MAERVKLVVNIDGAGRFPFKRGFSKTVRKKLKDYYKKMRSSRKEMPKWCK